MSGSADEEEFLFILETKRINNDNRSSLVAFNTRREVKLLAEIEYRGDCAMACLDGKKLISSSIEYIYIE